jgi:hypothetical protein
MLAAVVSRSSFKTAGDCPDFSVPWEKNGTVPFSEAVLKLLLVIHGKTIEAGRFFGLGASPWRRR